MRLTARSTLFPYTTLFRSEPHDEARAQAPEEHDLAVVAHDQAAVAGQHATGSPRAGEERRLGEGLGLEGRRRRSEEHTSELQSHVKLVCRLLLEKKK